MKKEAKRGEEKKVFGFIINGVMDLSEWLGRWFIWFVSNILNWAFLVSRRPLFLDFFCEELVKFVKHSNLFFWACYSARIYIGLFLWACYSTSRIYIGLFDFYDL
jgi:hypothetical protein